MDPDPDPARCNGSGPGFETLLKRHYSLCIICKAPCLHLLTAVSDYTDMKYTNHGFGIVCDVFQISISRIFKTLRIDQIAFDSFSALFPPVGFHGKTWERK